MLVGNRIRSVREAKGLSQGDIEKRTGLLRPYLSRIENGHTVPSVETLNKLARALGVPLYQLFHEGGGPPPKLRKLKTGEDASWGGSGKQARLLNQLCRLLAHIGESDRKLLISMAQHMARR